MLTFLALLAMMRVPTARAINQPARICLGDTAHPVVSGEAWLIANRWAAYQGVLVATIRNGKMEPRSSVQFPPHWNQAFDYKLLLAVANQPVAPPASPVQDFAYGAIGPPEYLKRFSTVYLSPPMPAPTLGRDWPTALQQIGRFSENDLVLPLLARRTIRLLYPDGRPLAGAQVPVRLYGSSENHCGVAVGIDLGTFISSAEGEISVIAPNCPLALSKRYFEAHPEGPVGEAFSAAQDVVIGNELATTVKLLWTLPQHDYVLRVRTAKNQPIARAHLTACTNFDGCGAEWTDRAPESDGTGTIRFREQDLRLMRSITVVSEDGSERNLTDSEMHDLLTMHQLDLQWK